MRRSVLHLLCYAWAIVVASGVFALARHDLLPGIKASSVLGSDVPRVTVGTIGAGRKTVIMFVHPKCPCTTASLEELRQLMVDHGSHLNATVVMFRSATSADNCTRTAAWISARRIPGVEFRVDLDGKLAKQCGAHTSGQVFLYDESGALKFDGGITGSRGHVGDNNSLDTLISFVSEKQSPQLAPARTPVFGCQIYSETMHPLGRDRGPR